MRERLRTIRAAMSPADVIAVPLALVAVGLVFVCLLLRGIGVEPFITLFSVTVEQNVPTWYASGLLLIAAVVAGAVGKLAPREPRGLRRGWFVLATLLAALSLDDTAGLHERFGDVGADLTNGASAGGLLHFTWVVPGFLGACLIVLAVVQLTRRLRTHARRQLTFGIALFLGGALGLEMISGVVLEAVGDGLAYALVTGLEELLEMLGVVVILRGMLQLVEVRRTGAGALSLRYVDVRPRRAGSRSTSQPDPVDALESTPAAASPVPDLTAPAASPVAHAV